jgi:hypothetical protein
VDAGVVVRHSRLLDLPADQFQPESQIQFQPISFWVEGGPNLPVIEEGEMGPVLFLVE